MTDRPEVDVDSRAPVESPGVRLRRARAAVGLTTRDVATRLRLSVDTIEALEQDRYDRLPAQLFVRGYLRNYCALLGLPADELLDSYAHGAEVEPAPGLKPKRLGKQAGYGDRTMRYVTVAIAVVLLGLVAVWWYNNELFGPLGSAPGAHQAAPANGQPTPPASTPEPATPEPPQPQDKAAPPTVVAPPSQPPAAGAPAVKQAPEASTAQSGAPAVAPPPAPPAAASQAPPAAPQTVGADRLTLRFNGTSWLEVHDATGKRLAYQLARQGDVVTLHGKGPFTVLLGNSPVVEVQFNGEPFDQSPYNTHGKTARFEVGK